MIDYRIERLTLEEKIGQLIVFGFDALELNDHAIDLIKTYKAGNVILFARNVKSPKQVFELNQNLQKLALETMGIPLYICIDQEGGMVTRIKQGATYFPGAMTLAATNHPQNAYDSGRLMGAELNALGINMNLAPSLDINNNPLNPVIGVRSFGEDAETVMTYGIENIRGMQEHVIATAKHFPGHGDTSVDSHLDLPKVDKPLEDLYKLEIEPFRAAIKAGVKAIMSSHINFPSITENGLPATLSRHALTGLLREGLGFSGLIITDCMQMKAIQTYYTTKKGTLMAINAGADMVCISHARDLQIGSIEYLKTALKHGDLSMDLLDERVQHILASKKANIHLNLDQSYDDIKTIIEDQATKTFALDLVRDGCTLAKGELIKDLDNTLLIASEPLSTSIADEDDGSYSFIKSVNQALPSLHTHKVSVALSDAEIKEILSKAKNYKQVIFCSYNANIYKLQQDLIRALNKDYYLHVIAMRNPYDSHFVKDIQNLILMYEYTPNSVKVLIEYLKQSFVPKGKSPVKL